MTTDSSWRIQVSFKTQSGTLINCRAENADELLGQIGWVHDNAGSIHSTEQNLNASATVAQGLRLAPPAEQQAVAQSQPITAPQGFVQQQPLQQDFQSQQPPRQPWAGERQAPQAPPAQTWTPSAPQQQPQQGQQPGQVCKHGLPAKYVAAGISKAGRPYKAFLACPLDRDQQCDFKADAA